MPDPARRVHRRSRTARTIAALAALPLVMIGCGSSPARTDTVTTTRTTEPITQIGVQMRILRVDDRAERVAQALARYDERGPAVLSAHQRALWREWGLRWVSVPVGELDSVFASQIPKGAIDTRWLGEFPDWRALVRLGDLRGKRVRAPGGVSREINGRPALIARAWSVPEISDGSTNAILRLDLALTVPKQTNRPGLYRASELIGPGSLSATLDGRSALVLVGEDPRTVWVAQSDEDATPVEFEDDTEDDPMRGPRFPIDPTLGERMLTTRGRAPEKVLLVLVPQTGPWVSGLTQTNSQTTSQTNQGATP